MHFDRLASAGIVRQRAARRWFLDAHEACAVAMATREGPAGTYDPAALPAPPKVRPSKAPRHRALVRDLAGLRLWRDMQHDLDESSWLVGDNDNFPDPASAPSWANRQVDADHGILPSADLMMRAVTRAEPERDGDYTTYGNLRFWRGRLTGWRATDEGEWLRPTEKYSPRGGTTKGATGSTAAIRAEMARVGDWEPSGGERTPAIAPLSNGLGAAHHDWILVSGWRNHPFRTPDYVPALDTPVTRHPSPALPTLGHLPEQFLGFKVRGSATASEAPLASAPTIEDRKTRAAEEAAAASLPRRDRKVLQKAMTARTMEDIGEVVGLLGKTAQRKGLDTLVSAAKNFEEILLAA